MRTSSRWQSEDGVILVFTAIAIVVLMGFLTFVFDYGILWVSRAEAQTSADAGALSGAIARAYDDTTDTPAAGGIIELSALKSAYDNSVWYAASGEQAANVSYNCPTGITGKCVRVDVYRNGQFSSSGLPIFFGQVLGITDHGVRATATARVTFGNAVQCMRPFSVTDRWWEYKGDSTTFDRWVMKGGSAGTELMLPVDWYEPPTLSTNGSGYSVPADIGVQVHLKTGAPAEQQSWSLPVRLPDGEGGYVSGADDYRTAIAQCIGSPVAIGDYLPLENGEMTGPTEQGLEGGGGMKDLGLFEQDPTAEWDTASNTITGSCAPGCAPFSPRIVPIAVIDVDEYMYRSSAGEWTHNWVPGTSSGRGFIGAEPFECPGAGKECVRVSNIIGFFVESVSGNGSTQEVIGRVVMYPGEFIAAAPSIGSGSAFLQVIQLVR